jgi:hypothetical protein
MQLSPKSFLRSAAVLAAILGLGASFAAACPKERLQGVFYCNHESTYRNFITFPSQDPSAPAGTMVTVPTELDLIIAGAGQVTYLEAPVTCSSIEYSFNLGTMQGAAFFKLRDRTGDVLAMNMSLTLDLSGKSGHLAAYQGTFTIDGKSSTGRFSGASGSGGVQGWAEDDVPGMPVPDSAGLFFASGQGYWVLNGIVALPEQPRWSGRK